MIRFLIGLCILSSLFGCATTPLSTEEVNKIHNVYLEDDLGESLSYVKLGFTIWGNKIFKIEDPGLYDEFLERLKAELSTRGYTLVPSREESDIGLIVGKLKTYNYPSGQGVDGAGFFNHRNLLVQHQLQTQLNIYLGVKNPQEEKIRHSANVVKTSETEYGRDVDTWEEYPETERQQLISALSELMQDIHIELLDKVNLLPKTSE